jgi:hypothetical protein
MLQRAHERCASTTTTTAPARVDLGRNRCARAGVGPCGMVRIVLKNGKLVRRAAPRMPKDEAT